MSWYIYRYWYRLAVGYHLYVDRDWRTNRVVLKKSILKLCCLAGIRRLPFGQAADAAVHVPEEEPEEEGDGLLLVVHVGQVPQRAL
jgi:hypothetical protein